MKDKVINFRIPTFLNEKLEEYANQKKISKSEAVRFLLNAALQEEGK